jgi:hypothetical protein
MARAGQRTLTLRSTDGANLYSLCLLGLSLKPYAKPVLRASHCRDGVRNHLTREIEGVRHLLPGVPALGWSTGQAAANIEASLRGRIRPRFDDSGGVAVAVAPRGLNGRMTDTVENSRVCPCAQQISQHRDPVGVGRAVQRRREDRLRKPRDGPRPDSATICDFRHIVYEICR